MKTLAKTKDYLITQHNVSLEPSKKLIITFGVRGSGLDQKGFGTDFALKSGFDTIYVAQRPRSQYQGLSVSDFADAVSPAINSREVFTYGASLGAYCAIYYGGIINSRIIASAPRNSAHPSVSEKSLSDVIFQHPALNCVPRSVAAPIVLFDPFHSQDVKFIDTWFRPTYPDAILKEFPFAGHSIIEAMFKSKVLKTFILSIWEKDIIIDLNLQQEGCHIWHRERGSYFRRKKEFARAKEEFQKSIDAKINGIALNGLLQIYINERNYDAVLKLVDFAVYNNSKNLIGPHISKRLLEINIP